MTTDATTSDKSLGLALLFGALAAAAALSALVTGQLLSAWGFAGGVVFAVLAVAAIHVFAGRAY